RRSVRAAAAAAAAVRAASSLLRTPGRERMRLRPVMCAGQKSTSAARTREMREAAEGADPTRASPAWASQCADPRAPARLPSTVVIAGPIQRFNDKGTYPAEAAKPRFSAGRRAHRAVPQAVRPREPPAPGGSPDES